MYVWQSKNRLDRRTTSQPIAPLSPSHIKSLQETHLQNLEDREKYRQTLEDGEVKSRVLNVTDAFEGFRNVDGIWKVGFFEGADGMKEVEAVCREVEELRVVEEERMKMEGSGRSENEIKISEDAQSKTKSKSKAKSKTATKSTSPPPPQIQSQPSSKTLTKTETAHLHARALILSSAARNCETSTRASFRLSRPPLHVCPNPECLLTFPNLTVLNVHLINGASIHEKVNDENEKVKKEMEPVDNVVNGGERRNWRVRRLMHSKFLDYRVYSLDQTLLVSNNNNNEADRSSTSTKIWVNKDHPNILDPTDKRGSQQRNGQLVEGYNPSVGKRPGYAQSGFRAGELRPGEGRARVHMKVAEGQGVFNDVLLRLGMDKVYDCSKSLSRKVRSNRDGDGGDDANVFICNTSTGNSKATVTLTWSGLVYTSALIKGEFNGYKPEPMSSSSSTSSSLNNNTFVLTLSLSPGVYKYIYIIDGVVKLDESKGMRGVGKERMNVVTVCNEAVLGGQGGAYNHGRESGKNKLKNKNKLVPIRSLLDNNNNYSSSSNIVNLTGMSPAFDPKGGPKLTTINLIHNNICDDGCWSLSNALTDNHRVSSIDLSSNQITSLGLRNLSTMLATNSTLTRIRMNDNNIGYDGARSLANSLTINPNIRITELELAYNSLGDDGVEALCEGIKGNGTIKYINLDGNSINHDGCICIGDMIKCNKTLACISLTHNNITNIGARGICDGLVRNCNVECVDVSYNRFFGASGLLEFGLMMIKNDTLNTLAMSHCNVIRTTTPSTNTNTSSDDNNVEGLFELCRSLRINRSITNLDLTGNKMTESNIRNLITSLHDLDNPSFKTRNINRSILTLKLDDNNFDGDWLALNKIVSKDGFTTLPSIPLYCQENRDRWLALENDERYAALHWLESKKEKRKEGEVKRKQRGLLREVKKEKAVVGESIVAVLSAAKSVAGGKDYDDDSSIMTMSSLGSYDDIKINVNTNHIISLPNQQHKYDDNSSLGDDDMDTGMNTERSIRNFTPPRSESRYRGSNDSLAPSIDSTFLASIRSSLFGGGGSDTDDNSSLSSNSNLNSIRDDNNGGTGRGRYLSRFKTSSMFSLMNSDDGGDNSTIKNSLEGSLFGDEDSYRSDISIDTNSMSSYAMGSIREAKSTDLNQLCPESNRLDFRGSFVPPTLPSSNKNPSPKHRTKTRAREVGEWRLDRQWISQSVLDKNAKKVREDADRETQIARQLQEDEYINLAIVKKTKEMNAYFVKRDGKLLIHAVTEELNEFRKDQEAIDQLKLHNLKRQDLINKTHFYEEAKLRLSVKQVFDIFDGDASGQIGIDEFEDLMNELCIPMSKSDLEDLVHKLDDDNSGELDFDEFFVWYRDNYKEQKKSSLLSGIKLHALKTINASLGSTAEIEARRILTSNEVKDVVALCRHNFRAIKKPQFECVECLEAFEDLNHQHAHDNDVEDIHATFRIMHERAKARHRLVDLARFRVTKGENYPKFFAYPPEVAEHTQLQVFDRPDVEIGRPLGVINHDTTVIALGRSGEEGTEDWLRMSYQSFPEAWILQVSRKPVEVYHLIPLAILGGVDIKEEKRRMREALNAGREVVDVIGDVKIEEEKVAEEEEEEESGKKKKKKKKEKGEEKAGDEAEENKAEVEIEADEETVVDRWGRKRKKKKKLSKAELAREARAQDLIAWPRSGLIEFFPVPNWMVFNPTLGSGTELNIRSQPNLTANMVGFMISTEAIRVTASSGDWLCCAFKKYDGGWILARNLVGLCLVNAPREVAQKAAKQSASPWDWTYDYVLNAATEIHITGGSRDALGALAFERMEKEKINTSTKHTLGL